MRIQKMSSLVISFATALAFAGSMTFAQTTQTVQRPATGRTLTPAVEATGSGTLNFISKWIDNAGALGNSRMFDNGTFFGIGTNAPQTYLHVGPGTDAPNMPGAILYATGSGATGIVARDTLNDVELAVGTGNLGGGQFAGLFGTRTAQDLYLQAAGNNWMIIKTNGRVGIGTLNPTATLDVAGNVNVTGNIAAKYQDLAEWVPAATEMDAGTVVVLNSENVNEVMPSDSAYDTAVAGVVSDKPGILLGEASSSKAKIATTGRVRVRVDATRGAIVPGDLLVTSDEEGTAMKSEPVELGGVKIHRPGTIIGKALEPLASGKGDILVLLSLQ